jgi:hypothetical protein
MRRPPPGRSVTISNQGEAFRAFCRCPCRPRLRCSGRLHCSGADLRWHDVRKKDGVNGDNTAFGVKVGMNF